MLDLLAVTAGGAILRLAENSDGNGWDKVEVARVPDASSYLAGEVRLHAADLDNNGAIDLLLSRVAPTTSSNAPGALVWLGDAKGSLPASRQRSLALRSSSTQRT